MKPIRHDEGGYIVVETAFSFTLYFLLIVAVLSTINVVVVKARVHNALTQTAEAISTYAYVLDLIGISNPIMKREARANKVEVARDEFAGNVNMVIQSLQDNNIGGTVSSAKALGTQTKDIVSSAVNDPKNVLQDVLNYALSQGSSYLLQNLYQDILCHYLGNGALSGEAYLAAYHVVDGKKGLHTYSFSAFDLNPTAGNDSKFLDASGDTRLVVEYDIDFTFGILPLKFTKLHVRQEALTKAWLGGKGEGYKK